MIGLLKILLAILLSSFGIILPGLFAINEHRTEYEKKSDDKHIYWILICCSVIAISMSIIRCILAENRLYKEALYTNVGYEGIWHENVWYIAACSLFYGLLMSSVMMDIAWKEIYEFVWAIGLVIVESIFLVCGCINLAIIISLGIYFVIQEVLMSRTYGKADCHAFCCCALVLAMQGMEMEYYVLHMAITLGILFAVQLLAGNVNLDMRLRKPVAMIPYIAAGFFVIEIGKPFVHFS